MIDPLLKFRVAAYALIDSERPSFAFPLLRTAGSNHFAMQNVDEVTHKIRGFNRVDVGHAPIITFTGPTVRVGDEQVFVFVSKTKPIAGSLDAIRDDLVATLRSRTGCPPSTQLQIAELVGTDDEKIKARVRMRNFIAETIGAEAANKFVTSSILRTSLWDALVHSATSKAEQIGYLQREDTLGPL